MLEEITAKFADFFFSNLYALEQRFFDLYLGTSTAAPQLTSLDFFQTGSDSWPYEGCQWPALRHALNELNPTDSDVFVDLGSGKGKALLMAGLLPYQRVVGVELDAAIAECAQRNLERARPRLKAAVVDSEISNAAEWPIPENASTIFMFNPFFGDTFRKVASRIFDSYDRNPRRLHIVYEHPWEHDWLMSTGRVVVENVRSSTWPSRRQWWESGDVIVTYHVTGAGGQAGSARCLAGARSTISKGMQRWDGPNGHRFERTRAKPITLGNGGLTRLPTGRTCAGCRPPSPRVRPACETPAAPQSLP
jgi:SAM-dependent methyltransferase